MSDPLLIVGLCVWIVGGVLLALRVGRWYAEGNDYDAGTVGMMAVFGGFVLFPVSVVIVAVVVLCDGVGNWFLADGEDRPDA